MRYQELRKLADFGRREERLLAQLHARIAQDTPAVVEDFYRWCQAIPEARRLLEGRERVRVVRRVFGEWLNELFLGPFDHAYEERHGRIGTTHFRFDVPQTLVLAALSQVRSSLLHRVVSRADDHPEDCREELAALSKALDIEFALIAGSYDRALESHERKTVKILAEAKRLEQDRFEKILDVAGAMIVALDRSGRVQLVNRKTCETLGWEEDELLGANWFDTCIPSSQREMLRGLYLSLLAGEQDPQGTYENAVVTKEGDRLEVVWQNTVLRDGDGKVLMTLSSGLDVTEANALRRELQQKEKLARLGEMAAVVAHEVKNPLAGIRGAMQILEGRFGRKDEDRSILRDVVGRIDSLTEIVNDILNFAHPREPQKESTPLLDLIRRTATRLGDDPRLKAVVVEVSGDDVQVAVDSTMMGEVFLNLLLNAAHAMDGKGTVAVRVARERRQARIEIADAGRGIAEEDRGRIFEPFFTTKSRGSGLGLAVARRTLEAHRGSIDLRETSQEGTTFLLCLPLHAPRPGATTRGAAAAG